jgi:hypothetical protein
LYHKRNGPVYTLTRVILAEHNFSANNVIIAVNFRVIKNVKNMLKRLLVFHSNDEYLNEKLNLCDDRIPKGKLLSNLISLREQRKITSRDIMYEIPIKLEYFPLDRKEVFNMYSEIKRV